MIKQGYYLFILFTLSCPHCFAQNVSETNELIMKIDVRDDEAIGVYMNRQTDLIALNSIIEVNGIVHPRDTYGYIDYVTKEGCNKRCFFEHWGGIISISKRYYDEILELPDTSTIRIAICLQSPVYGNWGGYWDKVIVNGYFTANQLRTTKSMFTPCIHFIITSIGKKIFKIQFYSWKTQTCYYRVDSIPMTKMQRKRLDRKEHRIYELSKFLHFERKLW